MMDRDDQMAELFARWKGSRAQGTASTPEEICADSPDLLDDFRSHLPIWTALEDLIGSNEQPAFARCDLSVVLAEKRSPNDLEEGLVGGVFESQQQFVEQLSVSGLLSAGEVDAVVESLPEEEKPRDAEQLARLLVGKDRLTAFQIQQITRGRGNSLVLGNYILLDKLGEGGMGVVFKARHRRMERIVALKVLTPNLVDSAARLARFHREAKTVARLEHRNIVAAYDADEADGRHFLVMQYVSGQDLSSIINQRGPLSVESSVEIILQAARGLDYAHKLGVIHRDIKPANLLIDAEGTVKILDMGLARVVGEIEGQAELTASGAVMGTVDYMAPEQSLSIKHADTRSDIYSLGVTLWYVLIGRPIYDGDSLMSRMLKHREAPIPSLRSVRPDVPKALESVFRRMVAKSPADRYQNMTDVIRVLERYQNAETGSHLSASRTTDNEIAGCVVVPPEDQSKRSTLVLSSETTQQLPAQLPHEMPAIRAWWQDRRMQLGGGLVATAVLLAAIVVTIQNRDGSKTVIAATSDPKSVEISQDGRTLVTVETEKSPASASSPAATPPAAGRRFPESVEQLASGFVPLFNGANLSGWQGSVGDPKKRASMSAEELVTAQKTADERMRAHWRVESGVLITDGKGDNLCTAKNYADFDLYLEWKIAIGGDTGVYLRGAPQVQIWDSATWKNGKNMGSGGLYNNRKHPNRPLMNADKPIGEWNAMLIRMIGEKVTVGLNGQLVVDNVVYENFIEPNRPIYSSGPIELQKFGKPVEFRNIRIRELDGAASQPWVSTSIESGEARTVLQSRFVLDFTDDCQINMPSVKLDWNEPFTLEVWVNAADGANTGGAGILRLSGGTGLTIFQKWGDLRWGFMLQGKGDPVLSSVVVESNRWRHLAGVRTADEMRLYVNGKLVGRRSIEEGAIDESQRYWPMLGATASTAYFGHVGGVRISKGARYERDFTPPAMRMDADSATVALYHCDVGEGSLLQDASGNGHDVKIVGAKWVKVDASSTTETANSP